MNRNDAIQLWSVIHNYAKATAELEGEGNSGEFHDAKEAKKLAETLANAESCLTSKFLEITGYKIERKTVQVVPIGANRLFPPCGYGQELWYMDDELVEALPRGWKMLDEIA